MGKTEMFYLVEGGGRPNGYILPRARPGTVDGHDCQGARIICAERAKGCNQSAITSHRCHYDPIITRPSSNSVPPHTLARFSTTHFPTPKTLAQKTKQSSQYISTSTYHSLSDLP